MKIDRPDKDSGLGIYAKSVEVDPKQYREVADQMIKWFNETNGTFAGEFEKAYAVAHCQVFNVSEPLKLFVVDEQLVNPKSKDGKQNLENTFFESQAIWNAEILESPEKVTKQVPKRKIGKPKDGKVDVEIVMEDKEVDNIIEVPEACMSFPHKSKKNIKRFYRIKARYQYLKKNKLGIISTKTFEGWVSGLKSHIIQHECQHFEGKNMYYD